MLFLDVSKAFGRVKYSKVFRLLLMRKITLSDNSIFTQHVYGTTNKSIGMEYIPNSLASRRALNRVESLFPLYSVYILLSWLRETAVGCYLGEWFVEALAYADDIVVLAPSTSAMRRMLAVCDVFAKEFQVQFNASMQA